MNTIINRQIRTMDIQPIEELCFEHVESSYLKVVAIRITIVYLLLIASALLIVPLWDNIVLLIGLECAFAAAYAVNVAHARKIYNFKGYALRDREIGRAHV